MVVEIAILAVVLIVHAAVIAKWAGSISATLTNIKEDVDHVTKKLDTYQREYMTKADILRIKKDRDGEITVIWNEIRDIKKTIGTAGHG